MKTRPDPDGLKTPAVFNYRFENGRRYHGYKDGAYFLPNDKREQDRLDLQHSIYRGVLNGHLYLAPIGANPKRVLDLGTGTGNWAAEFAEQHPKSQVLGTDLSPIQRLWVPPNCSFEIDDFEEEWSYATTLSPSPSPSPSSTTTSSPPPPPTPSKTIPRPTRQTFTYIHARSLTGSISSYPRFLRQAHHHLSPHGYLELQSIETTFTSTDGTHLHAPTALRWQELLIAASRHVGKELCTERHWKRWMEEAGFVDVQEVVYKVPVGGWAKDARLKELGRYQAAGLEEMVEAYSMALFTRVLGWEREEVEVLMRAVAGELGDRRKRLWVRVWVVFGRRGG
ncbi:hypothetical protein FQN55_006108 [Onygenales sp. PD_40]|nr:hypothetical protein FQN55_006108 [Onygenales sp. PD_40]